MQKVPGVGNPTPTNMHRPDVDDAGAPLPPERQDKHTIVSLEREQVDQ